jgi:hypothetical protein
MRHFLIRLQMNPKPARTRWTSFVADQEDGRDRILHEQGHLAHRLRVEHNADTLLEPSAPLVPDFSAS